MDHRKEAEKSDDSSDVGSGSYISLDHHHQRAGGREEHSGGSSVSSANLQAMQDGSNFSPFLHTVDSMNNANAHESELMHGAFGNDDHDWCGGSKDSMAVELSSVDSAAVNEFKGCGISSSRISKASSEKEREREKEEAKHNNSGNSNYVFHGNSATFDGNSNGIRNGNVNDNSNDNRTQPCINSPVSTTIEGGRDRVPGPERQRERERESYNSYDNSNSFDNNNSFFDNSNSNSFQHVGQPVAGAAPSFMALSDALNAETWLQKSAQAAEFQHTGLLGGFDIGILELRNIHRDGNDSDRSIATSLFVEVRVRKG